MSLYVEAKRPIIPLDQREVREDLIGGGLYVLEFDVQRLAGKLWHCRGIGNECVLRRIRLGL